MKNQNFNETELILRAKQGDVYARNQLIENNLTLIKKIGNVFNKSKPTFQSSNSEERNRL